MNKEHMDKGQRMKHKIKEQDQEQRKKEQVPETNRKNTEQAQ
jgi:hypothetical protein